MLVKKGGGERKGIEGNLWLVCILLCTGEGHEKGTAGLDHIQHQRRSRQQAVDRMEG